MSSPSNLYAEKVFSEHPTCLWPLDDKSDYISLISETDRNVYSWTPSNGVAVNYTAVSDEPFPNSSVTRITGNNPSPGSANDTVPLSATFVSGDIANFQQLNQDMATFCIGAYFYAETPYVDGFEIGYQYYDTVQGQTVKVIRQFSTTISEKWIFVSETFDIPTDNATFKIILGVRYLANINSSEPYRFLINGVSVGQWSEEFNSLSLGVTKSLLPSNILGPSKYGIPAKAYGLQDSTGYYLVKNDSLVAKNSGVPMVYGASTVSILSPNGTDPSLIVPGYGFMNKIGQYKSYTFESWLRITADTSTESPRRIFGPIRSSDGLYVDGPFLKLKIGETVGSHYIGEWCRPMLVHIRVIENSASLLINGEQVLSLEYQTSDLVFPEEYSGGMHNDWLGFYAYDDVSLVEVDSIAIYSYQVPAVVAKRRFIYGQGVEFPENINTSYSGTSVYIDYPFADYTNNYSYPNIGSWGQGVLDNISTTNNILTAPNYNLPTLVFQNTTEEEFLDHNATLQTEVDKLITFGTTGYKGYMLFPNLNILNQDTKAIYGIFKDKTSSSAQTLILIENEITKDYFEIELNQTTINYKLKYGSSTETIYQALGYQIGEIFSVGINFENFGNYYGAKVSDFFANKSQLKVYVGSQKDFTKAFDGNIYKIGFCNESNYNEISYLFNSFGVTLDYENVFDLYAETQAIEYDAGNLYFANGGSYYNDNGDFIPNLGQYWDYVINGGDPFSFVYAKMIDHTASYTLFPKLHYGNFMLDIAVKGSWQDYIPLTYFAQYVTDAKGKRYYDLDFLQFNIDYPAPSKFAEIESATGTGWTYAELEYQYSNPIQRTYASLDNHLYTGYNDYDDLKNKSSKNYVYDTTKSLVKTNITFQYTETGNNAPDSYFVNSVRPDKGGIVEPGEDWINTKYEVVDNMLIYPPVGANFDDLSVVVSVDFEIPGIITNPVKVKKLEFASQAFNKDTSNPVGTRFGNPIYPYKKSGLYFDYKTRNPFSIYKSSSPYLYMTRYSGIQLRGQYDPSVNRGLSMPINQTKAENYKAMAMQLALRYDEDFFPYAPTQIFEIQSKDSLIKFYMVSTHPDGKRAKIYAINANTGRVENGIAFYLNGLIVKDPTITIKQWAFLGISFSKLLDFHKYRGAFRVNGPILVNTISHYQSTNLQEVQRVSKRPWFRVKFAPPLSLDWEYWHSAFLWQGVLVLSTTNYYGVDPSDIYKTYTGTNKIIVDDPTVFSLNNYEYVVVKDVSWQSNTVNAV